MILELIARSPDWWSALNVALTRPAGLPERRADEDPWGPVPIRRPRRISDDLAWFRYAMEHPADHGLRQLADSVPGAWEVVGESEAEDRLKRLAERRVLEAAGFVLHFPDQPPPD